MGKFMDKFLNLMKLNDNDDYDEDYMTDDDIEEVATTTAPTSISEVKQFKQYNKKPTGKIVKFNTNRDMELFVIKPTSLDDAQDISNHLRTGKPVVINLENLEIDVSQRIIDFVSGACYAIDGNLQGITKNIFIVAPQTIDIAGDFRQELITNGIIVPNWNSGDF